MSAFTWTDDMGAVAEHPQYEELTRRRIERACEFWTKLGGQDEKPAFSGGQFVVAKNDAAMKLLGDLLPGLEDIPGIFREKILATAVFAAAHFAHDGAAQDGDADTAFQNLAKLTNAAVRVRNAVRPG